MAQEAPNFGQGNNIQGIHGTSKTFVTTARQVSNWNPLVCFAQGQLTEVVTLGEKSDTVISVSWVHVVTQSVVSPCPHKKPQISCVDLPSSCGLKPKFSIWNICATNKSVYNIIWLYACTDIYTCEYICTYVHTVGELESLDQPVSDKPGVESGLVFKEPAECQDIVWICGMEWEHVWEPETWDFEGGDALSEGAPRVGSAPIPPRPQQHPAGQSRLSNEEFPWNYLDFQRTFLHFGTLLDSAAE